MHARLVQQLHQPQKRSGRRALYGSQTPKEYQFELSLRKGTAQNGGQTFWGWYKAWAKNGEDGLFDRYRKCGGDTRHTEELADFVTAVLEALTDQERPTLKSLHDSVLAAIANENARRHGLVVPMLSLPNRVGINYVRAQLARLGCSCYMVRSSGLDTAYRDMHALGVGIVTYRALERVEIDEYTIDLVLLMQLIGILKLLTPIERKVLGIDGGRRRVVISAAICVHTRCLLALQIVPEGISDPLRQTLEMIYHDKSSISDALGGRYSWPQGGAPEEVVLDRGPKYVSDEAYHILASLGITNIGSPAGKPWLKPFIERIFRTLHRSFLARLSGRTFGSIAERGENDPAARASLDLQEFLAWVVRWIVDGYHNEPHSGLGMTPRQAWEIATADCPPRQLTNREMRLAFGTSLTRTLGRHGLLVDTINYQNSVTEHLWLLRDGVQAEICYWGGDIGAIEVRTDKDEWATVTSADPQWIGKTDVDLRAHLATRPGVDPEAEAARLALIGEIDKRSLELKGIVRLLARPREAVDIAAAEAHFARFTDTAERRHLAGPAQPLFAGRVDVDAPALAEAGHLQSPNDGHGVAEIPDDKDLMD